MTNLVLALRTEQLASNFIAHPSQSLIVSGPEGAGKLALASELAAQLLKMDRRSLNTYPYFWHIAPINGTLSIDVIRHMQHNLQLKTLGKAQPVRRIIIIQSAEMLTLEAQNALLKSLEEPPADTLLILTVNNLESLLPTLKSRAQHIGLKEPSLEALQHFFRPNFSDSAIERAYRLSGGLPGLMSALLENSESHPLVAAVESVKQWLRVSAFERLLLVDQLAKQKAELDILFMSLERISQAALVQAAEKQQPTAVKRWQHILRLITETRKAYARNAQPKLLLTNLMIKL